MAATRSVDASGSERQSDGPRGIAAIDLRDVAKVYQMGKVHVQALQQVSLRVERGEWIAVMGPSGSGKSTLLHVMGCLDVPSSGSYLLNGVEVSGMGDDQLAAVRSREIGFVFQTFNLLPRTSALKQVMLPMQYMRNGGQIRAAERHERARRALEQVGLADRLAHQPGELSGGERQRVAIARALVNNPSILMADEPTGNLDSRSGGEIISIFHDLHVNRGITIVVVTHDTDIAAHADRIVRLHDGRIVEATRR